MTGVAFHDYIIAGASDVLGLVRQGHFKCAVLVHRGQNRLAGYGKAVAGFVQLKGERSIDQVLIQKVLSACQCDRALAGDNVAVTEQYCLLGNAVFIIEEGFSMELPSQVVGDFDPDPVNGIVIGHTVDGLPTVHFLHQIKTGSGGVVVDCIEAEAAIGGIFRILQPPAFLPVLIGLMQRKAEVAFAQNLADQFLASGNLGRGGAGLIAVIK